MAELDSDTGIGLIERVRQGLGKPSIIYVKQFIGRAVPRSMGPPITDAHELPEVQKMNFMKYKNRTSGHSITEPQEVQNLDFPYNNKNYLNNSYLDPSIHQSATEPIDAMDRNQCRELVKEKIGYIALCNRQPEVNELVELITDVLCSTQASYRIGGTQFKSQLVKERLSGLEQQHIEYVLDCMKKNTTKVRNIPAVEVYLPRSVFWQMCYLTSSKKTLQIPDSNPDDEIDDSRTETTLTISITGKTASQMEAVYGFSDFQKETLDYLLSERSALTGLFENTAICHQDALDLLRALPENLPPERRAVVEQALSLVGKVNYFWGGKSLTLGWDNRWGQLREVASPGSPTTGTYRPYGLDCSGFVDWVFYNTSGGEYVLSHGGGAAAQHRQCEPISWGEAQPGDLVFYPNDDHVGIVGLRDSTGNLLIIHCASGQNNVVITDSSGFMTVGRSLLFTNIGTTN